MKRSFILALHRYIGLATGVFFLVTAVTGSLMLFKRDILYGYYPALADQRETAEAAPDDKGQHLLSTLWEKRLETPIRRVRFPDNGWPFYDVTYANGDTAYFSPSGQQLVRTQGYENPVTLIFDIHHDWMLGEAGETASGYVHLLVLLLLVSGVWAWWPKRWRKSLHLAIKGNAIKVLYSWHRVIGALSALLLILAVATGVMMVFYTPVQSVLTGLFGGEIKPVSRKVQVQGETGSWEAMQKTLEETLPRGDIRIVGFPQKDDEAIVVRKRMPEEWHQNGRSFIYINPYTSDAYSVRDASLEAAGLSLTHKIYPLHSAGVGGSGYRWLMIVMGFVPLLLVPTGFYIWWWRKQRASKQSLPVQITVKSIKLR